MRAYNSVFDVTTLTFTRKLPGQFNLNHEWVEPEVPIEATGDLQPYQPQLLKQIELPRGFIKRGSKLFSTKAKLQTVDDYDLSSADTLMIGDRKYYVGMMAEWDNSVLSTDYNTYILMIQAPPNEGEYS